MGETTVILRRPKDASRKSIKDLERRVIEGGASDRQTKISKEEIAALLAKRLTSFNGDLSIVAEEYYKGHQYLVEDELRILRCGPEEVKLFFRYLKENEEESFAPSMVERALRRYLLADMTDRCFRRDKLISIDLHIESARPSLMQRKVWFTSLSERLQYFLSEANLRAGDIAFRAEVNELQIEDHLEGKSLPTKEQILSYASLFDVPVRFLDGGHDIRLIQIAARKRHSRVGDLRKLATPGERLKKLCENSGLSAKEVAFAVGTYYETPRRHFGQENIGVINGKRYAALFDVPLDLFCEVRTQTKERRTIREKRRGISIDRLWEMETPAERLDYLCRETADGNCNAVARAIGWKNSNRVGKNRDGQNRITSTGARAYAELFKVPEEMFITGPQYDPFELTQSDRRRIYQGVDSFGALLRNIIELKGISYGAMAHYVGVVPSSVRNHAADRTRPDLAMLERYSEGLDIPMRRLRQYARDV